MRKMSVALMTFLMIIKIILINFQNLTRLLKAIRIRLLTKRKMGWSKIRYRNLMGQQKKVTDKMKRGGEEEGGESNPSSSGTSTSTTTTTTTTTPATTVNSATSEEGGGGGTASATVVAPSPVSDSKFYAIRTTGGQERVVANVLLNKIRSKSIGIYSILLLENFKGYIIVEAPDANVAFQALAGVRHIRGQIRGELPFKDIEGYLIKKPVVTELSIDDTVEVIAGPFKAMKAKITRVDYEKQEATVVLLDSPYQIPVTVDANYLKKALH